MKLTITSLRWVWMNSEKNGLLCKNVTDDNNAERFANN